MSQTLTPFFADTTGFGVAFGDTDGACDGDVEG
jgi:hypothetical protein